MSIASMRQRIKKMNKKIVDQIAEMVTEELKSENSVAATMKGVLKNVGDMKEPLRYAASRFVFTNRCD